MKRRQIGLETIKRMEEWNKYITSLPKEDMFSLIYKVKTPISNLTPIHFDSIIGWRVMQQVFKEESYNYSPDHDDPIILYLPLKKEVFGKNSDKDYFYCISSFYTEASYLSFICKRFYEDKTEYITPKKIDTGRGFFKSYKNTIVYNIEKEIEIRCIGNKDIIYNLLGDYLYIGKKTGIGYGLLELKDIKTYTDKTEFWVTNNTLIRPIPKTYYSKLGINFTPKNEGIFPVHAPYYGIGKQEITCYY